MRGVAPLALTVGVILIVILVWGRARNGFPSTVVRSKGKKIISPSDHSKTALLTKKAREVVSVVVGDISASSGKSIANLPSVVGHKTTLADSSDGDAGSVFKLRTDRWTPEHASTTSSTTTPAPASSTTIPDLFQTATAQNSSATANASSVDVAGADNMIGSGAVTASSTSAVPATEVEVRFSPLSCKTPDDVSKLITAAATTKLVSARVPIQTGDQWTNDDRNVLRMHVYAAGDIVSDTIHYRGGWEGPETSRILGLLQHKKASSTSRARQRAAGLLLDIGANIGWFSLNAAARGNEVIAFEPFARNALAMKQTVCDPLNHKFDLSARLAIYMMGLGRSQKICQMWQIPKVNFGDTAIVCDDTGKKEIQRYKQRGFQNLGTAKIGTLDGALAAGVFPRKVDVMKMDVEG